MKLKLAILTSMALGNLWLTITTRSLNNYLWFLLLAVTILEIYFAEKKSKILDEVMTSHSELCNYLEAAATQFDAMLKLNKTLMQENERLRELVTGQPQRRSTTAPN